MYKIAKKGLIILAFWLFSIAENKMDLKKFEEIVERLHLTDLPTKIKHPIPGFALVFYFVNCP